MTNDINVIVLVHKEGGNGDYNLTVPLSIEEYFLAIMPVMISLDNEYHLSSFCTDD